jgi:hypothetical protein
MECYLERFLDCVEESEEMGMAAFWIDGEELFGFRVEGGNC